MRRLLVAHPLRIRTLANRYGVCEVAAGKPMPGWAGHPVFLYVLQISRAVLAAAVDDPFCDVLNYLVHSRSPSFKAVCRDSCKTKRYTVIRPTPGRPGREG
jgi:hypothetical protein